MIKVNVLSEEKSWNQKIKKKSFFFNNLCKFFPKKFKFNKRSFYLTLLLSNNKNIKILNKKFRNKNKNTDILSFPFGEKLRNSNQIYLGDIIISFNYIDKSRNLTSKEFREKTAKIFIHGFLHLLGYDHIKYYDYKKMIKEEEKIFKSIKKILN